MNTANTTRLNWIEQLPEVGTPILHQRDDLLALLAQIDALQEIFGMVVPDLDFAGKNMRCDRDC